MISEESTQFVLYIQPPCNFHGKFISKKNKITNFITSLFCDVIFLHKAVQSISILYIINVLLKRIKLFKFSLILWIEAVFYAI